jgi:hypothetical protein
VNDRFLAPSGGAVVIALLLAAVPAAGQGTRSTARAQKPAAAKAWVPSRTPDGQPDVQGFWAMPVSAPPFFQNIEEGSEPTHNKMVLIKPRAGSAIVDPPDGKVPYQPWAAAVKQERFRNIANPNPELRDPVVTHCVMPGVPRAQYEGVPPTFQIVQSPGFFVLLFDRLHAARIIPVDGRPHAAANIKLWMGDSRGRWDGNTLVVTVTNHNDRPWLDWAGNFHSDRLRVLERWTFVDGDTINYEATMEDPKVYLRPWKMAFSYSRIKQEGFQLLEDSCYEGEQLDADDKRLRAGDSTAKAPTAPR